MNNQISTMEYPTSSRPIKEYFGDLQAISTSDILIYAPFRVTDYYLREITDNTYWRIEACYDLFLYNKSITLVFNKDVLSPYRKYTQSEVDQLFDTLDQQYFELKKLGFEE